MGRFRAGVCVALAAAATVSFSVQARALDVPGTSVRMAWAPARGPVQGYLVWVSRNGGPFQASLSTPAPQIRVAGAPGETVQIAVAAYGRQSGQQLLGPLSPVSVDVRFLGGQGGSGGGPGTPGGGHGGGGNPGGGGSGGDDDGTTGGGSGGDDDGTTGGGSGGDDDDGTTGGGSGGDDDDGAPGGGAGRPDDGPASGDLGLPRLRSQRVVQMNREWEVLDVGAFTGDGDADVLYRFRNEAGVWVLALDDGVARRSSLVTFDAVSGWRGPREAGPDRDLVLVSTPASRLEAWSALEPERLWRVVRSGVVDAFASDLSSRGERVVVRGSDGTLRAFDGSPLPVQSLASQDRVVVRDVDGDGSDDVLVVRPSSGALSVYLDGTRRRSVPPLAGLDEVTVADLQGDGDPELVGIDGGGRLLARSIFGDVVQELGVAGRGARIFPADLDDDGRDELLVQRGDELRAWRATSAGGGGTGRAPATIAVYHTAQGQWYLAEGGIPPASSRVFAYGYSRTQAFLGDWDGDGTATVGAYDTASGTWHLRNGPDGGPADHVFAFGFGGAIGVVGDWNGDGRDTVGVVDPATGTWYLQNGHRGGPPDRTRSFGTPQAHPVVGDWDGDGRDDLGAVHVASGTWELEGAGPGGRDLRFQWGAGAWPVAGDWDADGRDGIGAYVAKGGHWALRNRPGAGAPDLQFDYGFNGTVPVVGR